MHKKRLIFGALFLAIVSTSSFAIGFAQEDNGTWVTLPPSSTKHTIYVIPNPPFQIAAPSGWYMSQRTDEPNLGGERVVFSKYDPAEVNANFNPYSYFSVVFLLNKNKVSIEDEALEYLNALQKKGAKILSPHENIYIDNNIGIHFTVELTDNTVSDVYLFEKNQIIIFIKGVSAVSDFAADKKKIKESINSIKFSMISAENLI